MTTLEQNYSTLESMSIEYMLRQGNQIQKLEQCPECLRVRGSHFSRYIDGTYICPCGAVIPEKNFIVTFSPVVSRW